MVTIVSSQIIGGVTYYTIQVVVTNATGQNSTQNITGLTAADIYNTYGQIVGGYVPPGGSSLPLDFSQLYQISNSTLSINSSGVLTYSITVVPNPATYNSTSPGARPLAYILLNLAGNTYPLSTQIALGNTGSWTFNGTVNVSSNATSATLQVLRVIDNSVVSPSTPVSVSVASSGFDTYTVTIQAPNGNQQTFTVKGSDFQSYQSTITPALNVVNNVINHNQTSAPNTVSDITAFITANPQVTTYQAITVTIKAINGTTQSFTLLQSDWNSFDHSTLTVNASTLFNTQTKPVNVPYDIFNFLAANSTGGSTPPPPPVTPAPIVQQPIVNQNTIMITYSSTGDSILITRNGQALTNPLTSGTLTDSGLANGTYQYSFVASKNNILSVPTTVSATVNYTAPPTANNFRYNVQIPNVANAFPFTSSVSYGTAASGPIPARQIAQTALNQTFNNIPNTLNALFVANVSDADNTLAFAQYLATTYPNTSGGGTPQPKVQGNIATSFITLLGAIFLLKK